MVGAASFGVVFSCCGGVAFPSRRSSNFARSLSQSKGSGVSVEMFVDTVLLIVLLKHVLIVLLNHVPSVASNLSCALGVALTTSNW